MEKWQLPSGNQISASAYLTPSHSKLPVVNKTMISG